MASARAPAKVIITGEHFVVHGQPALAAAINLYSKSSVIPALTDTIKISALNLGVEATFQPTDEGVETPIPNAQKIIEPFRLLINEILNRAKIRNVGLHLKIMSQIPIGVGLGSSASTAVSSIVALARFLNLNLTTEEICEVAMIQERLIHKHPSGIDPTTIVYGGVILFRIGHPPIRLSPKRNICFIVGNTGSTRTTGDLVTEVSKHFGEDEFEMVSEEVGRITLQAAEAYEREDFKELGRLMDKNHELLVRIGVSTPMLNKLAEASRRAGALGAKLTGAGGGGCIIALSTPEYKDRIMKAIMDAGGQPYQVLIDEYGAKHSDLDR
ncbi:mevalonate kinase [Candidatus Bathyarchaeota archaeon]|nr:mevalonate kinase [Candidatus Bathyarchaeota archaeon]